MKRLLVVLTIAVVTACNNSETNAEKAVDTSAEAVIDSLKTKPDSSTNNSNLTIDSVNKADSVKKAL